MKLRPSKFHSLCFVSVTFSCSIYVSSGEINKDKNSKDKLKELFVQAYWFINTLAKEQSPMTKHRASMKMSLMQSEILIDKFQRIFESVKIKLLKKTDVTNSS